MFKRILSATALLALSTAAIAAPADDANAHFKSIAAGSTVTANLEFKGKATGHLY
ncbi:MAG: hypothetical protein NUV63_10995 [Gallionella sp.]|nr:hypothetical protein [Gallionella sp.]